MVGCIYCCGFLWYGVVFGDVAWLNGSVGHVKAQGLFAILFRIIPFFCYKIPSSQEPVKHVKRGEMAIGCPCRC